MKYFTIIEQVTGLSVQVWARESQPYADLQYMARMQIMAASIKLEERFGDVFHVKTTRTMEIPVPGSGP